MSLVNPSSAEFADAIAFQSVTIETQLHVTLEIGPSVTDLDVFEHLDKPYVTAVLGFVDVEDVVGSMNLSGGEKVSITLKTNLEHSFPVTKNFYIDKVIASAKTSDNEEFFTLHLIEDHAFISNLLNVNKSFSGKTSKIVEKIAIDQLDVKVDKISDDAHETKVIVPNLTPIDAMCWVKNRATTRDGYPFYLYSTFVDLNLKFNDMKTMMNSISMNAGRPYTYYESQTSTPSDLNSRRVIMAYQAKDIHNLYSLIDKGMLGSEHQYLDITKNKKHTFVFDVDKEITSKLQKDNIVDKNSFPLYDSSRYDWSLKKIKSRKITRIGGTNVFNNTKSLSEREDVKSYKLNETSRTLTQLITSDAMVFIVNGIDFFDGLESTTIGNKLEVRFLRNSITGEEDKFDHKKSGDYLIFACKHSFTPREYTLTFSGVKLSNGEVI